MNQPWILLRQPDTGRHSNTAIAEIRVVDYLRRQVAMAKYLPSQCARLQGVLTMVETVQRVDIAALPPAPNNPLPYRQQIDRDQGILHRNRSAARCRRAGDPMQVGA